MSRPVRVEVPRTLAIRGEEIDCVVTCTVLPGYRGGRDEPGYGAEVDEVLGVRIDAKGGADIPAADWPADLAEDVREAAVEIAADQAEVRER